MSFGRVKHSSKKVAKAYYKSMGGASRKVTIEVVTNRMGMQLPKGKNKGYYEARACVRRKTGSRMPISKWGVRARGSHRCSTLTWGYTPTAAIKKALHSLAKSLK